MSKIKKVTKAELNAIRLEMQDSKSYIDHDLKEFLVQPTKEQIDAISHSMQRYQRAWILLGARVAWTDKP